MRITPPTPYASQRPSIDGSQLSATLRACGVHHLIDRRVVALHGRHHARFPVFGHDRDPRAGQIDRRAGAGGGGGPPRPPCGRLRGKVASKSSTATLAIDGDAADFQPERA